MAGKPIVISVVSDTKQAVSSVKNLSTEYSGLVDQLKQLGPDGQQAAEELESSMKAAQLATQDASDASKQLVDSINKAKLAAAEGGLDLSADLKKTAEAAPMAASGIRQVSEEGGKLKEGLMMNAGFGVPMLAESLGSGEGGLAGAATAAGQAIGGMGMMMGPEVMVPAAALGAIFAWVGAQLGSATEESAAFQASVGSDVDSMLKLGPTALQQADTVNKSLQSMADNSYKTADGTSKSFQQIQDDAKKVGVSVVTMMQAYAGVPDAISKVTAASAKSKDAIDANARLSRAEAEEQKASIDDVTGAIGGNTDAAKKAAQAYSEYEKAQEKSAATLEKLTKAEQSAKSAADGMNSSLQSDLASTGSQLDQILDRSKSDADAIITNQQKELDANKRFLSDFNAAVKDGLDAAGQQYVASNRASFQEVIDTYGINSPQAKQFLANANALGQQQGSDFDKNFTTSVGNALVRAQQIMNTQKLHPEFDLSGSYAQVNALMNYINNQRPEVFVNVKGSGPLGSRIG
ncbi:hypothetical protein [Humibacter ginsenosidimutans]|uniref:Uncharacterized protein n=1 Tax=Humibacter ginsenosidimutans TaxID=2599293 RepID=A0A5B8M0P6_9MICO|nr:hypothetical protein [Humibacter ginsenosidimutans]QDZ14247.1 hypothetical protein FPZ11_05230 [Humibacter ginsenosidimutans]